MRYKNYIDKTYNLYENTDKDFYDTLTGDARKAYLSAEMKKVEDRMIKRRDDAVREYTTTGKMITP